MLRPSAISSIIHGNWFDLIGIGLIYLVTIIITLYTNGERKSITECTVCCTLRQMGYKNRRGHPFSLEQEAEATVAKLSLKLVSFTWYKEIIKVSFFTD